MKLVNVCITTPNVERLSKFYAILFGERPEIDGEHHSFSQLTIWNSGNVISTDINNTWLQFSDDNIDDLYNRLVEEIPDLDVIAKPTHKPWGAYSFWIKDPDGNKIAIAQKN